MIVFRRVFTISYSTLNVTWVTFTIIDFVTWVTLSIFDCGLAHVYLYLTAFYAYVGSGLILTRQASN